MHNAPSWVEDGSEVKVVEGNCAQLWKEGVSVVLMHQQSSLIVSISTCVANSSLVLHISNAEE